MKIIGTSSSIIFDLENGYILKAEGEMLINNTFIVYKSSMKNWEPPHDKETLSTTEINTIIDTVKKNMTEKTIKIEFE